MTDLRGEEIKTLRGIIGLIDAFRLPANRPAALQQANLNHVTNNLSSLGGSVNDFSGELIHYLLPKRDDDSDKPLLCYLLEWMMSNADAGFIPAHKAFMSDLHIRVCRNAAEITIVPRGEKRAGDTQAKPFISYSSRDQHNISELSSRLNQAGINHWWDRIEESDRKSGIMGGDEWEKKIRSELRQSTHLVIYVSQNALESKWVHREILFADTVMNIPLIPILAHTNIDGGDLPLPLIGIQMIEAYNDPDYIDKLIEVLKKSNQSSSKTKQPAPFSRLSLKQGTSIAGSNGETYKLTGLRSAHNNIELWQAESNIGATVMVKLFSYSTINPQEANNAREFGERVKFIRNNLVNRNSVGLTAIDDLFSFTANKAYTEARAIAMPYYYRGSIEEFTNSHKVNVTQIFEWLMQISDALTYLHQKQLIHCCVKASNILINNDGKAVLGDISTHFYRLGYDLSPIARFNHDFAPPELLDRKPSVKTDVFCFALMAFMLLNPTNGPFVNVDNIRDIIFDRINTKQRDLYLDTLRKNARERPFDSTRDFLNNLRSLYD
jgi:hypothetical protein